MVQMTESFAFPPSDCCSRFVKQESLYITSSGWVPPAKMFTKCLATRSHFSSGINLLHQGHHYLYKELLLLIQQTLNKQQGVLLKVETNNHWARRMHYCEWRCKYLKFNYEVVQLCCSSQVWEAISN